MSNSKLEKIATELGYEFSREPIQVGDAYIAQRNTGPHLLKCKKVEETFIVPEDGYCYDKHECLKILNA